MRSILTLHTWKLPLSTLSIFCTDFLHFVLHQFFTLIFTLTGHKKNQQTNFATICCTILCTNFPHQYMHWFPVPEYMKLLTVNEPAINTITELRVVFPLNKMLFQFHYWDENSPVNAKTKPEDMRSILQTDFHYADPDCRTLIGLSDIHSENGDVTTRSRVLFLFLFYFRDNCNLETNNSKFKQGNIGVYIAKLIWRSIA